MAKKKNIAVICAVAVVICLVLVIVVSCVTRTPLKKSDISSEEAMQQFWNLDLDASAEVLNGFRAQSVDEVMQLWSQGKKQGNGALIYAVYCSDKKAVLLQEMKNKYGSWNMYYGEYEATKPLDLTYTDPIYDKESKQYISDVTIVSQTGQVSYCQVVVVLTDGGYFIMDETAAYADDLATTPGVILGGEEAQ